MGSYDCLRQSQACCRYTDPAWPSPNRSPTKWVRFGKEEGDCGDGVFAALAQTAETEWSRLLLTLANHANHDTKCTPGFKAGCILLCPGCIFGGWGASRQTGIISSNLIQPAFREFPVHHFLDIADKEIIALFMILHAIRKSGRMGSQDDMIQVPQRIIHT